MSNGSAGTISLDLIIKSKLEEQLEKIKSSVRSPAEKVGEQINKKVLRSRRAVGCCRKDNCGRGVYLHHGYGGRKPF